MLISYNWLKSYVPQIPSVEKVAELITFHLCEIENVENLENGDSIFDLKVLPDRAHDLLSHQGVARELSALLGISFNLPIYKIPTDIKKTNLKINIDDSNTRRYIGRIVREVKVGPSPDWMVKYLESVGGRSINNIVDATNIVMLDCGQPIHAFDLAKLEKEEIVVRNAREGDTMELVGREKQTVKLNSTDMVITDSIKSLAVAGVKGGFDSGVTEETRSILIEVASFDAVTIRKTARRLGIQSDASKRYENDLSASLCEFAMKEITSLIFELCGDASFEEVVDVYKNVPESRKVTFSSEYISRILGLNISEEEIEKILKNYNYEFVKNENVWEVVVPIMRIDISGPHDMAEEIGRVYGYDKIIPQIPKISTTHKDNQTWLKICGVKNKFIKDGYREVMTSVFTDKGDLEILASASDKNFLRTNIKDGLDKSYEMNRLNMPLLNSMEVKIFEVGACFTKDGEVINVAYKDKKNTIETSLNDFYKKEFGDEVPSVVENKINKLEYNSFKMWSIYPFIYRDIAVWVPNDINKNDLVSIYKEYGGEFLVEEPYLFDSFAKEGKTSYAYRLVFQSYDKTLTDGEVNSIMEKINIKIRELGWEVR
jgi:phenylalanyl-tRNA synthetase beta chain